MASLPNPKRIRCLSPSPDAASSAPATASLEMDRSLRSALAMAMADPSIAIGLSLERILDSIPLHSHKDNLVHGAMNLASSLMIAALRSARKLATSHNSSVWPLPNDLTINVFSRLDTQSLCFAAATCMLFRKCALDPLCYANIDFTTTSAAKVTDPVVSTMIQRAGKNLLSIRLGTLPQNENRLDKSPLTASCLTALVSNGGAAGLLLRKLHLYNLTMEQYKLLSALSACESLSELEIIGIKCSVIHILRIIFENCHSIERICLHSSDHSGHTLSLGHFTHGSDRYCIIKDCPLLSSLALRRCRVGDDLLSAIVKEARGLKSLDLSGSSSFSGIFLRDLGNGGTANSLETLILRDCMHLRAKEVFHFLSAVCYGDWKSLRYVDISNKKGLVFPRRPSGPHTRCAMEVSQVLGKRPDIHLIAEYPSLRCFDGDCANLPSSSSNSDSGSSSSDGETSSSSLSGSETSSSSDDETSSSSDDEV